MPATYEPIATTTLGSAASSITFSSIPGTYTDLRLVMVAKSSDGSNAVRVRCNSDSGTNYSLTEIEGSGSSVNSVSATNSSQPYFGTINLLNCFYTLDFFSYAGSTNKTFLTSAQYDQNGSGGVRRSVLLWRNTSAITAIEIFLASGNFDSGTTATLYGILKA